ncbi:MAG TPA: proline--tRNA ligase [Dehalococcoidales bacterium]|nr:proline--tRNA ligase [Dehalococcoidales bacterium]
MRISNLFTKTTREAPAESDTISHSLLVRAGMINQLAAGVYTYLPLGWRVLRKIENIVREEMDKAGAQEVVMPVLNPLEIWQQSGRAQTMSDVLFHLTDRRDREMVLGPTHEEVITTLAARYVKSYRDMPQNIYQIQVKFRDEPRPRGGLMRGREFIMKDAYSFDINEAGLDVSYNKMVQAYKNVFERCGLPTMLVEADSGAIGGKDSREFMVIAPSGEDEIIYCKECSYAANTEKAVSAKVQFDNGKPLPIEPVATPGLSSIEDVSKFLNIAPSHMLKVVFYIADGAFVMAAIRGDLDVNEIKLKNQLHASEMRLATDAEVNEAGIIAGFASPVGMKHVKVVADDSVMLTTNLVAGGNKKDTHVRNVNYPRDFEASIVADIALARPGHQCKCGGNLTATRGIEVGHVFKLLTRYSEKFQAVFTDEKSAVKPDIMGCYGMGVSRLMAAAVEQNHDDKGIIWPLPITPYQVYLCALYREGTNVAEAANKLYNDLQSAGVEVLFDDRQDVSPGVKFNDADLIGTPFRITISPRTLEKDNVEFKKRTDKNVEIVPLSDIISKIKEQIKK